MDDSADNAVQVINATGTSLFVLVCDHASMRIPERYGDLGLTHDERLSHIAWDPGALALAMSLSQLLDAPLVLSTASRLIIDTNRAPEGEKAIWTLAEATRISANENLDPAEREERTAAYHRPFHDAITNLLDGRKASGIETIVVCVHSFTPVFLGAFRPWSIGLIHGADESFTRALQQALLAAEPELDVGWNEPYSAANGVTYTLERHGDARELPATMIEIRNDEIRGPEDVARWAERLATALDLARQSYSHLPVDDGAADRAKAG